MHKRIMIWTAGFLAAGYGLVLLAASLLEERLLFHPQNARVAPAYVSGIPTGMAEVMLKTDDGETLIAWYLPARSGKPTILFFDGNGGHLPWSLPRWQKIAELGMGVFAVAYRGYSGSTGSPSEAGLHRDAAAGYAWLAEKIAPTDIIIHGSSLGTGVAARLASIRPARALVLESPYLSVEAVAALRFWFFPVKLLIRNPFRSLDWIGSVKMPILIGHGERDNTIPFKQGRALFDLANEPKWFTGYADAGHNDLPYRGFYAEIDKRFGSRL
jgi:uncharacterized protein